MKTYKLSLMKEDEEVQVDLRLDFDGLAAMKKKFDGESPIDSIYSAVPDAEKAAFIFTQALTFNGNKNTIKTGRELYNLLVDNDKCGIEGFWEVLSEIGKASGILSERMIEKLNKNVNKYVNDFLADDDDDDNDDEDEDEDIKNQKSQPNG